MSRMVCEKCSSYSDGYCPDHPDQLPQRKPVPLELHRILTERAVRAERERCAQVCRERAKALRIRYAEHGDSEVRLRLWARAVEAEACAADIEREG